jgi:hypothetical protein
MLFSFYQCTDKRSITPLVPSGLEELRKIVNQFPQTPTVESLSQLCTGSDSTLPVSCEFKRHSYFVGLTKTHLETTMALAENQHALLGDVITPKISRFQQPNLTIEFQKISKSNLQMRALNSQKQPFFRFDSLQSRDHQISQSYAQTPDSYLAPQRLAEYYPLFQAKWTYASDENWNLTASLVAEDCFQNSAYAPKSFTVSIRKESGVYKIQTSTDQRRYMTGLPASANGTCETEILDSTRAMVFGDFVSQGSLWKGSLFALPSGSFGETTNEKVTLFPLFELCTHFSLTCTGVLDLTGFQNPACLDVTTGTTTWNSNCSAQNADLGTASFLTPPLWIPPTQIPLPEASLTNWHPELKER